VLKTLRERGFCRVVMIHHPPLPGQAKDRKALTDAAAFKQMLEAEGAEAGLRGGEAPEGPTDPHVAMSADGRRVIVNRHNGFEVYEIIEHPPGD